MTERALALALDCLASVSSRLVVVGGTAHRLFPFHELGHPPPFELLTTEDVDIAAPLELGHDGGNALLEQLRRAGFTEEVRGADSPAYIYRLAGTGGAYLQFIAPLTGAGLLRDGRRDAELRFSGIHAEKLRHVDVLLHRPWRARVVLEGREHHLQVVNPVAYLLQKLLVLPTRGKKQGKDLLYVFDTLTVFGTHLQELRRLAPALAPALSRSAARQVRRCAETLCFSETSASREAARIAGTHRSRAPDSAQIVAGCRLGLATVLGGVFPGLGTD